MTINRTHANQYILNKERTKCRLLSGKEAFRTMGYTKDEVNLSNLTDNQAYKLAGNGWTLRPATDIMRELFKEK